MPRGKKDELKPRFEFKLPKDIRYVDAYGLACNAQPVSYLFVAQALGKNPDNFHLSWCQLTERRLSVALFFLMLTFCSKQLDDLTWSE